MRACTVAMIDVQITGGLEWALRRTMCLPRPPTASLPFIILTLVNAPYKRGFYCGDDSIRYPYRPDTITHGLMAGVIITATVILVRQKRAWVGDGPARPQDGHGGSCVCLVLCGCSIRRSHLEKPTWCTQTVCIRAPTSTTM